MASRQKSIGHMHVYVDGGCGSGSPVDRGCADLGAVALPACVPCVPWSLWSNPVQLDRRMMTRRFAHSAFIADLLCAGAVDVYVYKLREAPQQ